MKWNGPYNFSRWSHGPCFTDVSLAKQKRKHLKTPQIDFFYDVAYILINAINIENKLSMLFIMNLLVINLE